MVNDVNRLSVQKRAQMLGMLVEGNSLRSITRMADVSINTVTKLLEEVGRACEQFHNEHVVNVRVKRLQCDEIWSFVHAKEGHLPKELQGVFGYGDVYTWVAIDADTKLVPCWNVGRRDASPVWRSLNTCQSALLIGFS